MIRRKGNILVSHLLLLVLFSTPFLIICSIQEADAWLMHQTNCRTEGGVGASVSGEISKSGLKVKAEITLFKVVCDTEFHWNPFPHGDDDDDSSSGSCDSGSCDWSGDWCIYCEEEHWICNFGTGW